MYLDIGGTFQTLATLTKGHFFGEGALLKGKSARRGANVMAVTYTLIYALHVDEMHRVLVHYPKVMAMIASIGAEREVATEEAAAMATAREPPSTAMAIVSSNGITSSPAVVGEDPTERDPTSGDLPERDPTTRAGSLFERTSRSADKNIHTMTTHTPSVWGFGARSAHQGTDDLRAVA